MERKTSNLRFKKSFLPSILWRIFLTFFSHPSQWMFTFNTQIWGQTEKKKEVTPYWKVWNILTAVGDQTCTVRWNQADSVINTAADTRRNMNMECVSELLEFRRCRTNSPEPWACPPCSSWPPQTMQPPMAQEDSDLVYESTQIRERRTRTAATGKHFSSLSQSERERERERGAFSLERRYLNGLQEILSACSVVQRKRWMKGRRKKRLPLPLLYRPTELSTWRSLFLPFLFSLRSPLVGPWKLKPFLCS